MIEAQLKRLAKPEIGNLGIYEIRRSHVVDMLDEIADEHGARMADLVLAYVRKAFNWYATRDDEFTPPIVRGMARTKPNDRKRKRILADDEIRDLWAALAIADAPACFPAYVKTLLLTATRRNEAAGLHKYELDSDDLWTIPGARYKTKLDHLVPLSAAARELIGERKNASGFIFSTTKGEKPLNGFSRSKAALDEAIALIRKREWREPMQSWTFHDLRRTARSLMSRAKVPTDHAERCLGHVMGGVRGTYDRYEYLEEKRAAFEKLASIVDLILNPARA
jgi:integrase